MFHLRCNWNKVLLVATILASAAVGGFLAIRMQGPVFSNQQVGPVPSPHDPKTAEDEKAIQKMQLEYVKAFNAGDAKVLAAFWAVDGEFVDAEGKSYKGRNAIEKEFLSFFTRSKGLKLEISTDTLRFVSPDVALESGTSRVVSTTDNAVNITTYHIVHTKRACEWQLASVRESTYAPSSNYEQLRSIEWLVGNWVAKGSGQTLEVSCEWTAKRNFILRKYNLRSNDGTTKAGIQIIGWDPVTTGIRSWIFDSDGGFGSESWTKDGKRWVMEATGVARDGAQVAATNILEPIDHDNFTWQSVKRSKSQINLPDTALIKVTRAKSKN